MAKVLPRVEFVWPPEEASMVSNNYDAVMNKTWYCIASSDPMVRDLDVFWEVNKWKKGKEGKVFQNHTITRKQKNRKVKDYAG